MRAALWAGLALLAPAPGGDRGPPRAEDPASLAESLADLVPASLRPPDDAAARIAWCAEGLRATDDLARVESATRLLALALPEALSTIRDAAKDPHWRTRVAALDALFRGASRLEGAARGEALALARSAASDPARGVRAASARLLGAVGEGAEAALVAPCSDLFFDVRRDALQAAGRIGHPELLEQAASRLSDPDGTVRECAVDVLARGGPEGIRRLAPFLGDPESPVGLRLRACRVLRDEGTIQGAAPELRRVAESEAEPRNLRAAAIALLLRAGASFAPEQALPILVEEVVEGAEISEQEAAADGLAALGARASEAVHEALVDRSPTRFAFRLLLSVVPGLAPDDPGAALERLFDRMDPAREDERASVLELLGRVSPEGLLAFIVSRWEASGESTRVEALRLLASAGLSSSALCDRALADEAEEVRRLAFSMALDDADVPSARCVEAITRESDATLRGEFLELLGRRRPDATAREFLLGELESGDVSTFDSVVLALDVFSGDAEVVRRLVEQHDRAHAQQLEGRYEDGDGAWRRRRSVLRAVSRIGGEPAVAFLRVRARADRSIDADLSAEATRGLAALVPGDPLLADLLRPPSAVAVRIEAAIATTRRGDAEGVRTLAQLVRALDGDARRRAFDALAESNSPWRRKFVEFLALDTEARFSDESRSDAIRDLPAVAGDEAIDLLASVARGDRSLDSRLEAIQALGSRGGDTAAEALLRVAATRGDEPSADEQEQIVRAVAASLGATRSTLGVPWLVSGLFERALRDAKERLVDADERRSAFERRRRYDREREIVGAILRIGRRADGAVQEALERIETRGLLALADPTLLADVAEAWSATLPAASARLARAAALSDARCNVRFRSALLLGTVARDRDVAAAHLERAHRLAAAGLADAAFGRAFGPTEPRTGHHPRVWLSCAAEIARIDADLSAGRSDEAERRLESVLVRGRLDARVLLNLAGALERGGLLDRAREIVERASELAPLDRTVQEQAAWHLLAGGHAESALARFRAARGLEGEGIVSDRATRFGIASALASMGRLDEAEAIVRRLLEEDPAWRGDVRRSRHLASLREKLLGSGESLPPGPSVESR